MAAARKEAISPRRLSRSSCSIDGGAPVSAAVFIGAGNVARTAVSASCSQRSIFVYGATKYSILAYPRHRRGRERITSAGSCSSKRLTIACSLLDQISVWTCSIKSAAQGQSWALMAWRTASLRYPRSAYHWLVRRCRAGTASPSACSSR